MADSDLYVVEADESLFCVSKLLSRLVDNPLKHGGENLTALKHGAEINYIVKYVLIRRIPILLHMYRKDLGMSALCTILGNCILPWWPS